MSSPPELRNLCTVLSSTPSTELPRLVPQLLQNLLRCQSPLSCIPSKAQGSNATVFVHKLKTQISTNLIGRAPEGRFASVVLIKAAIEVGGSEVLKTSEPWIRALISVLGGRDPIVTKELCIVTLTKFYLLAQQYQTLVRELSTPTLPTFISSCLSNLSSKPTGKARDIPQSMIESIFRSFFLLLPHHSGIFRPFVTQIRASLCSYILPSAETPFITSTLKQSARLLFISLFQTAPKGSGGLEWKKAVEKLIRDIHHTADQIFRFIDEDWEPATGYLGEPAESDVNRVEGITKYLSCTKQEASISQLINMLDFLADYFRSETPGSVTISLGIILDTVKRFLLIGIPPAPEASSTSGDSGNVNPGAGREELDILRSQIPHIYITVIQLLCAIADRLQDNLIPLAFEFLDLLTWIFPKCEHIPEFRLNSFKITSQILSRIGKGLDKAHVDKLSIVIRSCCNELYYDEASTDSGRNEPKLELGRIKGSTASSFPEKVYVNSTWPGSRENEVFQAASKLLPYFVSYIPQNHLHISIRALIERAAIFSKDKGTMLACVLNPFVIKKNVATSSILPLMSREFSTDDFVEAILRPRIPFLPTATSTPFDDNEKTPTEEDYSQYRDISSPLILNNEISVSPLAPESANAVAEDAPGQIAQTQEFNFEKYGNASSNHVTSSYASIDTMELENCVQTPATTQIDVQMSLEEPSDDESVHLTMQIDTDSDSANG